MKPRIITDGNKFPIQPNDINISEHFVEAFDNMETEISARYVVKLCQKLGGWLPFTHEQIETLYREAGHHDGFRFNRLVKPEMVPPSLARAFAGYHDDLVPIGGGWVIINGDGKYCVTDDFVIRCFRSSPANMLWSATASV